MALDSPHTFAFYVKPTGGAFVNLWAYVRRKSISVVDAEGSEVDTLTIELENYDGTLGPVEWSECYLQVDGASYLFYGYITKVKPRAAKGGTWLIYELHCESSVALLVNSSNIGASNTVSGTWINVTARALVAAVFAAAGVTGWDLTTYVEVGPTFTSFTASSENLTATLDRIAVTAGYLATATWAWRVEANKQLRMGSSGGNAAPFGIASLAAANWTTTFPLSEAEVGFAEPEVTTNGSAIVNSVTVSSGRSVSVVTTETFSGDGSTVLFRVAHMPIKDVIRVTVGGVLQTRGVEGWDTHAAYNVLISYAGGTMRWAVGSAPAVGTNNISITYRYLDTEMYTTTLTDAASIAKYGQTFGTTITDNSITSVQQATDIANTILTEYANGTIEGSFVIERYGLKCGQTISIVLPLWSLNGSYTIRRVTTELDRAGTGVIATVRFGGHSETLGRVIASVTGGASSNVTGSYNDTVATEGEIGVAHVNTRIEFIDPLTTYVEP
jgi:hypothetical protein